MDSATSRETLIYELALEWAFRVPYGRLLAQAHRTGCCDERDLLQLGRRLFCDAVRLARGEISSIRVPSRLPGAQEHDPGPEAFSFSPAS
jgi:hypothetical protein